RHPQIRGQQPIEPASKVTGRQCAGRYVKVRNLPGGVHPGVGAAGDSQGGRDPGDRRQRSFQFALDGPPPGLAGPSGETRAVVADIEAIAQKPAIPSAGGGLLCCGTRGQDSASTSCPAGASAASGASDAAGSSALAGCCVCCVWDRPLKARCLTSSTSAAVRSVTSAMIAIGALSPLRGIVLTIRV